jgi:cytochrome c biogenesis protein CcmG, thiol:disulfide interchange protein DsbE
MKKTLFLIAIFILANLSLKAQNFTDFTLNDLSDNEVTLSKLLEKGPVLMSFWASWCEPCKEEMRLTNQIFEKYKDKGFTLLAVNEDNQKSLSKVKSYIEAKGYKFTVVLDTDKKVYESYWGNADLQLPFSLLIDKNKNIVAKHAGFLPGDETKIEEEVKSALDIK